MISFAVTPEQQQLVERVRAFVRDDVLPADAQVDHAGQLAGRWELVESLRERARARGIWAPHLPAEWGGLGLGQVSMALVHQECGVSQLASLGLGAMAPDEGNMHTLLAAATPAQQERWLRPLAEGRVRSCFAMTEPDVASSDPRNLRTRATRDGGDWVLNGRKWFITGADGAAFAIVVARTAPPEQQRRAYSLFVVPTDTPGWTLVRDPRTIGAHFVGGHCEIELRDVRVPADALLGEEGAGLRIAQLRLAGGRLAHAMRWIGATQAALDLTCERALERTAFGRPLSEQGAIETFLADSAIDLSAARLLVLHAAWKVEQDLPHRQEVAIAKTFVAEAFGRVLDRAVQVFGSHGIATDAPIARWWVDARAARIYDGASEVHRMTIARELLGLAREGRTTAPACGALS
ncbi:acyl-CoA dehydrogenase family protein [Conexibacter stalactiti]|uniref:Acyl-CoA dehydrogenase family protein n=1 Tax=Conexibacter stalactiti TaxID=1940611 RepID=A0ABU4HTA0_9ACTN|nr:acyl-CoA dehydrogenase family protein [Conexibacter stalactiti]MDW5596547.1 acyl-CoA dehydrogenase family protein [Conexibacter stalactiti]MEC5037189.1 acyl-CoA dehydrogenase family protein [Conexibacter stalactiti]